jgi:hypothetical protein
LPEIFTALGAMLTNSYWSGCNPTLFCSSVTSAMAICV